MTSPPPTHELISSETHQLTKSSAHKLISSKTHQFKNSLTQKLNLLFFYFTILLWFLLRSSENSGWKVGKRPLFLPFRTFGIVNFCAQNLHFAPFCLSSLVESWWFFKPIFLFLAPKNLLFNDYFALFRHVFHGSKRFCLYNCCGCLCFLFHI